MQPKEDKTKKPPNPAPVKLACSCVTDPFASLPPDLKPRRRTFMDDLTKVTCKGCEQVFWTNHKTDFCAECEQKQLRPAMD